MRTALLAGAALVCVALAVQVLYARAYAPNATKTTKLIWGVNIAMLVALAAGLAWYAVARVG